MAHPSEWHNCRPGCSSESVHLLGQYLRQRAPEILVGKRPRPLQASRFLPSFRHSDLQWLLEIAENQSLVIQSAQWMTERRPFHHADWQSSSCLFEVWVEWHQGGCQIEKATGICRFDSGEVLYAVNTFKDAQDRQILFAWLQEGERDDHGYSYSGCQSLPRQLMLRCRPWHASTALTAGLYLHSMILRSIGTRAAFVA